MGNYVETAAAIAREAGAIVQDFAAQRIGFELKGESDLVTEADRTSERLIVQRLKEHFPTHGIMAEEGGGHTSDSGYVWYVDPLDGTTNFAHGFPAYNVTLALEKDGEMIAGVVFDPGRDEMFHAEKGSGAWLNTERIAVSQAKRIEDALYATGFPSRQRHQNINIHFYYQLAMISHGVRRAGAAALDLAYVACGRLDGFWEFGLKPWDMAAGMLLVQEAGGVVSDMHGAPHSLLSSPHLLTSNGRIHDATVDLFTRVFGGEAPYGLPDIGEYPKGV